MDHSTGGGAIVSEDLELNGQPVKATLYQTGVIRWFGSSTTGSLVLQDDLLGLTRGPTSLTLHSFKLEELGCTGASKARVRKELVLQPTQDSLHAWSQSIQTCMDLAERPKRLLIFLNPFGGKKLAKKIFQQQVEPLLAVAGVDYTLKETQYQRHAKDLAKSMDLSQYDGIVCVSGDGVLVEVLNGLLEREDWESAMKMPLGVIPAGTGNGMARSVLNHGHEPCNVANATFAIIRGYKQGLDVATVVQGQACFHSVLMLTWGIVADVDIESEKLRSLGNLRNDIYSLIRILGLRKYHGSLSYVPAPGYEGSGEFINGESEIFITERANINAGGDESWHKTGYIGPVLVPEISEWRSIRGNFVLVWLQNVPWASESVLAAPSATFADGFLDLIIIKDCPWWVLLPLFLKLSDGSHVKSKHVEYLKVKAFRLAPGGRVGGKVQGGYIDLDGEVLARGQGAYGDGSNDPMLYGPVIQMTVEKGLATIFCAR